MTTDKGGSEYGAVKISYDVIVAYVSDAVLNTRGVVDLSGGLSDTLSQTILGKESRYRGVKIDEHDGVYNIDIYVIVAYGVQIPETAWNIQRNVKLTLEDVMAIGIGNVNIHVQGVEKAGGEPADGVDADA